MDGEDVHLIPIPRAHTDGDTMVYRPYADVIMTVIPIARSNTPISIAPTAALLTDCLTDPALAIGPAGPSTKIVPGHGPAVSSAEVIANREMILAIGDRVAHLIAQGKTQEEVLAANRTRI
jgi:cyclase